MDKLIIDPEFRDKIPPLTEELDDLIAVVAVQDDVVPDDEGRKDRPIGQDVFLQQGKLLLGTP